VLGAIGGPSFALGLGRATRQDTFEIVANGAGIAVTIGRPPRQKLGDHRPQRRRTRRAERFRRARRSDSQLQSARVGGAERLDAGQHLVHQHANGPVIGVRVDLARFEPFR